jgi:signal transduction histidine kinase/ligand-binding sensor domain-containing protein/DNA-binding response OmpR family regulator
VTIASVASNLSEFPYRNISMEDGLLASGVRNIVQDQFGFVWFGTDNGLCRYDGTSIHPYRIVENGVDQYISALMADSIGLYVGTSKGVYFFHFQTETFQRIVPEINNTIRGFSFDKDGNVWISLDGSFCYCYSSKTKKSIKYASPLTSASTNYVYADMQNRIWLIGGSGKGSMARLNKASNRFESLLFNTQFADFRAFTMIQTKDGNVWLGSWSDGLVKVNDDNTLTQVLNPNITGVGNHIHCLYEFSPTQLLIGCDDGLISYNPQDGSWRKMTDGEGSGSVTDRFVYSIMGDNEGGLWYGTFYGGINYLSPVARRFESYSSQNGLHGNVISRFCEDEAGRIWIASDDGGLNCFSQRDGTFVNFPGSGTLSKYNIHALYVDGQELWIGTYSDGIIRLNTHTGQMRHFSMSDGLSNPSAYSIFMDREKRMWIGTMEGLCLYDQTTGRFNSVKNMNALVIDIDEDAHGNIWAATNGNGIWRFNPKNKEWIHYSPESSSKKLSNEQVNCICIDSSDRIWATASNGFYSYNSTKDCFDQVNLNLSNGEFCAIIEDGGVLWISTTKGLIRYSNDESIQVFNRQDGLVSEQFQPNSALKASDGKLYFGTVRGFNAFYPYQIKVNHVEPSVFITGLKLYNKTIEVGTDVLPKALSYIPQVDLSYRDEMFSLSFAALSYCSPEKNQYAYMLEGFDKDWNYVGTRHEATYTNIPSGTYIFRVKATNNDGVWSSRDATLKIVVHPPFWLTLPAKLIYLLLTIAAIWFFTQFRLRKAEKRHQLELVRLNEKKEAEVRDARLKFFTMIAHEIRTPVSLIIGPLEKVKQSLSRHELSNDLDVVDRNAHRLLELVNQLLDFNKVQQEGLQLHFSLHNMRQLLRAVTDRFVPTLQQKNAVLQVNEPPFDFTAVVDDEAITKVISNLMTNATKYTKDLVSVSCVVDADNQHFHVIVEDNGMGVSAIEQKKIFNPFYQSRDNKPGTGIGLSIVKNIVDLHHGTVRVESEEGQGAKFIVTLPVHQENVEIVQEVHKEVMTDEQAKVNEDPEFVSSTLGSRRPKVLIVEDNEDMLNFLSNHFQKEYTVLTAQNGVQGLKQLKSHSVTLIISDWMMPEMDGAEFCKQVRADHATSHLPIILLTAKTDDDSKTMGMDVGADAYIEKPFSMKHLEATIRNLMEMRKLLLVKFSQNSSETITQMAKSPVDNDFLVKLNKLIEDNMCNSQLSVPFIANEMGISRSGLFAKLKDLTAATPNEMIQIVRLRKAAELLKDGGYRINEICYMVGFNSPSYFSKCFQQQFGMKPGDYAKSV